jgi:hypothetical protein
MNTYLYQLIREINSTGNTFWMWMVSPVFSNIFKSQTTIRNTFYVITQISTHIYTYLYYT